MNKNVLRVFALCVSILFCYVPKTHAWDDSPGGPNDYGFKSYSPSRGLNGPSTYDYSTYGGSASQNDQRDETKNPELLKQAAETAAAIADPVRKAEALGRVAQATAQAGNETKNPELLKQAAETAAAIADPFYKAAALQAVARVTAQAGSETKNPELLKQAAETAAAIADPVRKAEALQAVAQTAAKLGHWRQALDYARRNSYDEGKANAVIAILQVWYGVDEKKD